MKKISFMIRLLGAFFRLVRWPNLVFIAVTQVLFYYFILLPGFRAGRLEVYLNNLRPPLFYLLSLSWVLIAAAGYIINNYFVLNSARCNKTDNLLVAQYINRYYTIISHSTLSVLRV